MRTEPVTMNEFAEAVRQDLQERLSGMYPQLQVNIQHVDKLQGESYLGVRIDRGDGLASPVIDLEGAFHEMKVVRPYEKVLADLTDTARSVLNTMPGIGPERPGGKQAEVQGAAAQTKICAGERRCGLMKRRRRRKKPSVRDCKNCLYYNRKFKICTMGLNHCILNRDATAEMKKPDLIGRPVFCWNCPYGRDCPCVSFCMRNILEEWRKERAALRKEIQVYA